VAGKCGLFTYAVSFMSWFARNADTNGALRGESMKFSEEDINRILNLRGADGKLIDVFDLHGVIFIGNTQANEKGKEEWDLTKTYKLHSEHSIAFSIDDFEDCETEEDVEETFAELLAEFIENKLI